jgi:hypothetical protein
VLPARWVLAAIGVAVGAACGGDGNDVKWSNYAPGEQRRIDDLADAGDCAGLQGEFDTADETNAAQEARTGENNSDLMAYIDGKLEEAGCH